MCRLAIPMVKPNFIVEVRVNDEVVATENFYADEWVGRSGSVFIDLILKVWGYLWP